MRATPTTNATAVEHQTPSAMQRENFVLSVLAADLLYIHRKLYIFLKYIQFIDL